MAMYPTAQLRAFVEVAAEASFTRAAERLDISQPTASQLVRSLEKRVGAPLFVRGSRRVELTAAGRALLPHAERALALDAEAEAAVDRAASVERARLWVAAGEALATYVLPPALADLKHRLPRLEAGVIVGDVARILSALRSGEADAVLLTEHTAPADLESTVYARGRTVLISPLVWAVAQRQREIVGELLAFGAHVDRPANRMAPCVADALNDSDLADLLRKYPGAIDTDQCPVWTRQVPLQLPVVAPSVE